MAISTSLKHAFAQALASYLTTQIPGLTMGVEAADPEQKKKFPSLQIVPHKMKFTAFVDEIVSGDSDAADEVVDGSNHDMVVELGEFEGPVELRLAAKNQVERELYQSAIVAALNGTDETPGVTALEVADTPFYTPAGVVVTHYKSHGSVFLDTDDWDEEFVFEKHRFTFIEVTAQYPMLALRRDVPNIETLISAVTEDMDTDPVSAIPADAIESVSIAADGTISQP